MLLVEPNAVSAAWSCAAPPSTTTATDHPPSHPPTKYKSVCVHKHSRILDLSLFFLYSTRKEQQSSVLTRRPGRAWRNRPCWTPWQTTETTRTTTRTSEGSGSTGQCTRAAIIYDVVSCSLCLASNADLMPLRLLLLLVPFLDSHMIATAVGPADAFAADATATPAAAAGVIVPLPSHECLRMGMRGRHGCTVGLVHWSVIEQITHLAMRHNERIPHMHA